MKPLPFFAWTLPAARSTEAEQAELAPCLRYEGPHAVNRKNASAGLPRRPPNAAPASQQQNRQKHAKAEAEAAKSCANRMRSAAVLMPRNGRSVRPGTRNVPSVIVLRPSKPSASVPPNRQNAERQERESKKSAALPMSKTSAQVNREIVVDDLVAAGLTEEQAKAVVTAIAKGKVRNGGLRTDESIRRRPLRSPWTSSGRGRNHQPCEGAAGVVEGRPEEPESPVDG